MSWSSTNNTKLIFPQDDKLLGEINYMNMAVLLGMQETDFLACRWQCLEMMDCTYFLKCPRGIDQFLKY